MKYSRYNLNKVNINKSDISNREGKNGSLRYFIIRSLYVFIFGIGLIYGIFYFIEYIYSYDYEDKDVLIKQIPLGYSVYDKDGNFQEVKFYTGSESNAEIMGYLNNTLVYNLQEDSGILENETDWLSKTEKTELEGIEILGLKKIDDNNFILIFRDISTNNCFIQNTIDLTDDSKYCLDDKSDIFNVESYKNHYVLYTDNKIYILASDNSNITMEISSKKNITNIKVDKLNNLEIYTGNTFYEIKDIIFDYYLIKKIRSNGTIVKLDLEKMIR